MDEIKLKAMIDARIKDGIGSSFGELSNTRQDNLDRYYGELYGYEQDGESSVVTREALETVEWAMPSIMKVFTSSSNTVEFDPVGPEDEKAADQETDVVNHVFSKENDGFYVLHTWFKSALMMPTAYVKVGWEDAEEVTHESYEGLLAEELALLMEDPELEPIEQESCWCEVTEAGLKPTEYDVEGMELDAAMMGMVETFDVNFKRTTKKGKAVVWPLPEEEVIVARDQPALSLKDSEFVCHRVERTYSDLVAEGYDKSKLDAIGTDQDEGFYNEERVNRRFYTDENDYYKSDEYDKTQRKFWVHECYVRVDWDEDDYAELRKVVKIGNEIFENEEVDNIPIVALSSILVPHKHINISLIELVKDLQEIKTTITRQMLNNLYKTNNPRTVVGEGVNLDDLLSNETNGVIRAEDVNQIKTEPTTPIIGQAIPALELLDSMKETRTGISKNTMGLDANVLAQSTKGAYLGALEAANARLELIVRVFAETGVKELFVKLHELLRKHSVGRQIKVRGEWINVDPQQWRKRTDMSVRVGIGLGNKDIKLAAAQMILGLQEKMIQTGGMGTTVTPANLYNAAELLTESAGEVNVDKYFMNPAKANPKKPKPDPNMMMLQLQKQIEDQRNQIRQQELFIKQNKQSFDQFMAQQKHDLELAKEGRERAELELEYATDIPGGINGTGPYAL